MTRRPELIANVFELPKTGGAPPQPAILLKDAVLLLGMIADGRIQAGPDLDRLLFDALGADVLAEEVLWSVVDGVPFPRSFTTDMDSALAFAQAVAGSDLPHVLVDAGKLLLAEGSSSVDSIPKAVVQSALRLCIESFS